MPVMPYNQKKHTSLKVGINFYLTDHCNLNCKGCTACAPLQKKNFLNIEKYINDIQRLSYLSNGNVTTINLLGGEPLLHPRHNDFISVTRKLFNNANIQFYTNGILLPQQEEYFWKLLRDLKIKLLITEYPIQIDNIRIKKMIDKYDIRHNFIECKWGEIKWLKNKKSIDETIKTYINCFQNNWACNSMLDGKYFPCGVGRHFQVIQKLSKNIFPEMENCIDIHKVSSLEEILQFISNPIPLCSYCGIDQIKPTNWEVSKKELSEWIRY